MRRYIGMLGLLGCLAAAVMVASTAPRAAAPRPSIEGLHVVGNKILNGDGQELRVLGINISGSEYTCIQNRNIFDTPVDQASVDGMLSWNVNAVRVPLNEDCWLNINGVQPQFAGETYRKAIEDYVGLLNRNGLIAIIELHWSAPGTQAATGQNPMPDLDHSPAFWTSVASRFKDNSAVILDLFNEPFPDGNSDTDEAWRCWRDGGRCNQVNYEVAGMQLLVDTVRAAGAKQVLMLGGVQFSNALSQWLKFKPSDPLDNIAAAWHVYNFNLCNNAECWNRTAGPVAAAVPLIAGEIGENDCGHGFIDQLMGFLDERDSGYLGWAWNVNFDCGKGPGLITAYDGTPTAFGIGLREHLAELTR